MVPENMPSLNKPQKPKTICHRKGGAPKGKFGAPKDGIASTGGMMPENSDDTSFEKLYLESCCKNPNPNDGCDDYSPHQSDDYSA